MTRSCQGDSRNAQSPTLATGFPPDPSNHFVTHANPLTPSGSPSSSPLLTRSFFSKRNADYPTLCTGEPFDSKLPSAPFVGGENP